MSDLVIDSALLERMGRVCCLILSRDLYLPSVNVSNYGDVPGPAPSKRVPCELCDSSGRLRDRYCPLCDGVGWRVRKHGEDEWDEYVRAPMREALQPVKASGFTSRQDEDRRLSESIARLEAMAATREGRIDHERFAWEATKQRYWRAGSYQDLERQLAWLHRNYPGLWHHVVRIGTERPSELDTPAFYGVALIAERMPRVRVPSWLWHERAVRHLPTAAELFAQGRTVRQVARQLGLTLRKAKELRRRFSAPSGPAR